MKKAVFKLDTGKGGFLNTVLAPVNDKQGRGLGFFQASLIIGSVIAAVWIARFLVGH